LIHGYPLNHRLWEPQISTLAGYAQIIAPDLRGHGKSEPAPSPSGDPQTYTMDLHADDCEALLGALDISQPVVIAGLSMGGYIAFSFLRKYPQRVAGMILAATRPGADTAEAKDNRLKAIDSARKSGIEAVVEAMLPKLLASNTYTSRPHLVKQAESIIKETSLEAIIGDQRGMMERPDSTSLLQDIKVPTLLIHGADDQVINLEDMKNMESAIPNAVLHIIPDAGHLVNLEQPEAFNQKAQEFLLKMT
jgi:pimeloyl-ACP methyl ester carboxylesterase